ncbi:MAG: nucleotide exchange factor GrpE [Chloroflexota bacterium]|nr:nucleotide exchange factor GrpE [Chloroflexota bacterium]
MQDQTHSARDGEDTPVEGILPPGPEATEEERLQSLLDEAEREKAQFKALAQRAQADLINYRKRADEERQELAGSAGAQVILRVLPVLDDLHRALAHAAAEEPGAQNGWLEGFQLIERKLHGIFAAEGLERIEAEGGFFNPFEHEVVGQFDVIGRREGEILEVTRQGYRMNGRVIRPAQVVVQSGQIAAETQPNPQESDPGKEE